MCIRDRSMAVLEGGFAGLLKQIRSHRLNVFLQNRNSETPMETIIFGIPCGPREKPSTPNSTVNKHDEMRILTPIVFLIENKLIIGVERSTK